MASHPAISAARPTENQGRPLDCIIAESSLVHKVMIFDSRRSPR